MLPTATNVSNSSSVLRYSDKNNDHTSVTIPDSIITIGDKAFQGCTRLESVIIPYSVTNICREAFNRCYELRSIDIPNSVTSIG